MTVWLELDIYGEYVTVHTKRPWAAEEVDRWNWDSNEQFGDGMIDSYCLGLFMGLFDIELPDPGNLLEVDLKVKNKGEKDITEE